MGELVGEIAAASNEQAEGIQQVNTAVAEMDKVTQQNAATSEEMAASMATFKIRSDHSTAPTAATRKLHAAPVQQVPSKAVTVHQARPEQVIPMKDDDFKDF